MGLEASQDGNESLASVIRPDRSESLLRVQVCTGLNLDTRIERYLVFSVYCKIEDINSGVNPFILETPVKFCPEQFANQCPPHPTRH